MTIKEQVEAQRPHTYQVGETIQVGKEKVTITSVLTDGVTYSRGEGNQDGYVSFLFLEG